MRRFSVPEVTEGSSAPPGIRKSSGKTGWSEGAGFAGSNERLLRADWEGSISLVTDTTGTTLVVANTYDGAEGFGERQQYGIPGSATPLCESCAKR